MDIAGVVLQLVQCISPSISERWKYHRAMDENLDALKQGLEELKCRKRDIESRLNTELVAGETKLKDEVKNWLEKVERISGETDSIEAKATTEKYFSRASLGKEAFHKISEVRDVHSKGNFHDGLVIPLPRRGDLLPTTTTLGGETTFQRKVGEIQACLMDDRVNRIGVWGMGGIGKTTALELINNNLLKECKFEKVIWVTVSKDSNITKLRNKIAHKFQLEFLENSDEETRRSELCKKFYALNRYVLILDDLWEVHPLEKVGIPELTPGCKLVVTTRSRDVCREMSCEPIIEMELFSEQEALNLFWDIVRPNNLIVPKIEEIVKEIVRECACLPLAVVTVAGSLKGVGDSNKWEFALEELRVRTNNASKSTEKIFEVLRFSYDRLNDKKLQYCLLYCALYPEDYPIEKNLLIEQLIARGVIEKKKRRKKKEKMRQYKMKKGQLMLDDLVNVCLLSHTTNNEGAKRLKMHDLIRDMAIQITSCDHCSPRFLVEAGEGLETIPYEEEWKEDLVEVSLMGNHICEIPLDLEPPNCPGLSTMFLNDNRHLRSIPDNFFLHMKELNVLDISYTSIDKLPESVSNLVNLGVLLLRNCRSLQHMPSLAKLRNLRRLDLCKTSINEVPHGLEMCVRLRYLNLQVLKSLKWTPDGILCKFVNIRYLSLICPLETPRLRGEELRHLRKLESLYCVLYDLEGYNAYVRSLEFGAPTYYILELGFSPSFSWRPVHEQSNVVCLIEYDINESVTTGADFPLLLPENVAVLAISSCNINVSSLCELTSFIHATNLKWCYIHNCHNIEHLFSYSSETIHLLQRLEELSLEKVWDLIGLIRRERGSPSIPPPSGTFCSLKILRICSCDNIKRLFVTAPLPNLEELTVDKCRQLVEIISTTYDHNDDDEENQDEERGSTTDHAIFVELPKLRDLYLNKLPELESIPVVSDSLQQITIGDCPKLKRIPPLDREPFPPSLINVYIDEDFLGSMEWDYPNAINIIESMMAGDEEFVEEHGSESDW